MLQGLKNHAVTMFEVGKLTDESLDSFLTELDKVGPSISCKSVPSFVESDCNTHVLLHYIIMMNFVSFLKI